MASLYFNKSIKNFANSVRLHFCLNTSMHIELKKDIDNTQNYHYTIRWMDGLNEFTSFSTVFQLLGRWMIMKGSVQ